MANPKPKMPTASTDEQFKFLISCIRYSNNGKIDFAEVANECNIVSKGAAAKRYERMMKQHGLHQSASSSRDTPMSPAVKQPKTPKASPANKKRKAAALDEVAETAHDDDEGYDRNIKTESDAIVKDEPDTVVAPVSSIYRYKNVTTGEGVGVPDDEKLFDQFFKPNAFEQHHEPAHGGYDGTYDPKEYPGMEATDAGMLHDSILID